MIPGSDKIVAMIVQEAATRVFSQLTGSGKDAEQAKAAAAAAAAGAGPGSMDMAVNRALAELVPRLERIAGGQDQLRKTMVESQNKRDLLLADRMAEALQTAVVKSTRGLRRVLFLAACAILAFTVTGTAFFLVKTILAIRAARSNRIADGTSTIYQEVNEAEIDDEVATVEAEAAENGSATSNGSSSGVLLPLPEHAVA
eukprot:Clim_evm48s251 gene=Clim_evmTU48s251